MASIRAKNTRPEMTLRAGLRAADATGYRIHLRSLPGKPDVAFTRWKIAVFVDGVFWHGHPDHFNPEKASPYWRDKIDGNRRRDREADAALIAAGWNVVRFWDTELKANPAEVLDRVLLALTEAGWLRS